MHENFNYLPIDFMKKAFLFLSLFLCLFAFSADVKAQEKEEGVSDSRSLQDSIFEEDAQHNLNVARQYFKLKKAYKGVLMRFEETFAAYPQFSKMDEFLYYAGMSSFYLSENKGRQKVDFTDEADKEKFAPEKLKENAAAYFAMIAEQFPNSKYKDDAEKMLKKMKNEK
jgi:outer membrane protein assembly factor BamD (BamD/ComL family)